MNKNINLKNIIKIYWNLYFAHKNVFMFIQFGRHLRIGMLY